MRRRAITVLATVASLAACTGDDVGGSGEGPGDSGMLTSTTAGSATTTGSASAADSTDEEGDGSAGTTSAAMTTDTGDETAGTDEGSQDDVVPEFALLDLNPSSLTFEQPVSPRDHLEKVSGWYFTHAT
jgi:hypothetical protein